MSGRKFCRICLNEVLVVSTNTYSSAVDTKQILENIFPGMNTSLTNPLHLCEECFNNVNFANRLKQTFKEKQKEFLKYSYINFCTRPFCGLCFRFQTPDVIFLHKDNYSIEALQGIVEIALSAFKVLNAETNVCGVCWSWIKKIYSFKRRCFKMEEILKNFCSRNNLEVMTDENLDAFLFEQYCIRSGILYPPKQSNLTESNSTMNSDSTTHQEYFRLTGQVFSNLPDDRLTELEMLNNAEDSEYDWLKENKAIEDHVSYQDTIPTSTEVELETGKKTIGEYDGSSDTDDEFDETLERRIANSGVVIVLDDDDDDDDTKDVIVSNEDNQVVVSTLDNEFDHDIKIEEHYLNSIEDNIPTHFIVNNKNIKSMPGTENFTKSGDNNNNVSQKVIDNNLVSLNLECSKKNIYCGFKNRDLHKSSTQGDKCEIGKNVNINKNKNPEPIYCDTPQFSKIYQRCVNKAIEFNSQIREDNSKSHNFVFENAELDKFLRANSRKSTFTNSIAPLGGSNVNIKKSEHNQVILSSTFELFQSRFSGAGDITTSYSSPIDKNPEIFEIDKSDDIILLDEDCFEVVHESNNIINMANVDSYVKEMKAVDERKKSGGFQKNEIWGCHICIAKYSRRHQARKHMLFHEEPSNKYGKFPCLKCPYRAKRLGNVKRHSQLHIKDDLGNLCVQPIMYLCPYCSSIYNIREDIQAHINEHVISWKSFQCGDCMYTANKSESLRLHYSKYHCTAKDPTFKATVNWEVPEYTV